MPADNTLTQIMRPSVQVALERVKEYSELTPEPSEFIEPRPNPSWPANGHIKCEDLVVRYAVYSSANLPCF